MEVSADQEQQHARRTDSRERRKEQNKLAQRRFREKLRQRQQKPYSITEHETDQFLEFEPYATGSPNTVAGNDLSLHPQEPMSETIRECHGSNILGLWDSWSPCCLGSEVNDWAISYPDTDFNIDVENDASDQSHQDHVAKTVGNVLAASMKPRCNGESNDAVSSLPLFDINLATQKQPTASILESQRRELCCQANNLLHRTLSIYEIGISLGIFAPTPVVQFHLKKALESFRLLGDKKRLAGLDNDREGDSITSNH